MDAPMEKRRNVWTARTTLTLAGGISWAMMAYGYVFGYRHVPEVRLWPRWFLLILPALFFAARLWVSGREPGKKGWTLTLTLAGAGLILNGIMAQLAYVDVLRYINIQPMMTILIHIPFLLAAYGVCCLGAARWKTDRYFAGAIFLCGLVILWRTLQFWEVSWGWLLGAGAVCAALLWGEAVGKKEG